MELLCCQTSGLSHCLHYSAVVSLTFLLILAGDVELNPGPPPGSNLQNTPKDIAVLITKLSTVRSKWYNIGVQLEIELDTLDSLEQTSAADPSKCLTKVLSIWLRENTDVPVSWESLIAVLKSSVINENGLAKKLEEEFVLLEEELPETEDEEEEEEVKEEEEEELEDEAMEEPEQDEVEEADIHVDHEGRNGKQVVEHQHLDAAGSYETRIVSAPRAKWESIVKLVKESWDPKESCPTDDQIDQVLIIQNKSLHTKSDSYLRNLSNRKVEVHYHGTSITCDLANTKKLCNDQNCGTCGIASRGFDKCCIRQSTSNQFQRYGPGFYLAPNASKCHHYTVGAHGRRAILMCQVCPGDKHETMEDDETLIGPPLGCDSVCGQSGGTLKYDEIVLFNADAILPVAIIMYKKDGEAKLACPHEETETMTYDLIKSIEKNGWLTLVAVLMFTVMVYQFSTIN